MANTFRNDIYRSAKFLSYIVMTILGAIALCSVFYIVLSIVMLAFPDARIDLDDGSSLNTGLGLIGLTAILEIFLRILTIIFFLIWEYRSFNNLSVLRAKNLEYSPGWAVGWWFVPFANLVKPFQVMRELWNESAPDFDEETGFLQTSAGTPEIIGFWWGTLLLSGFIGRIADKMVDSRSGEPSEYFPVALTVASILQVAASILIILIVKGITNRQEQRFNKIASTDQFLPPPPTFYQNSQT